MNGLCCMMGNSESSTCLPQLAQIIPLLLSMQRGFLTRSRTIGYAEAELRAQARARRDAQGDDPMPPQPVHSINGQPATLDEVAAHLNLNITRSVEGMLADGPPLPSDLENSDLNQAELGLRVAVLTGLPLHVRDPLPGEPNHLTIDENGVPDIVGRPPATSDPESSLPDFPMMDTFSAGGDLGVSDLTSSESELDVPRRNARGASSNHPQSDEPFAAVLSSQHAAPTTQVPAPASNERVYDPDLLIPLLHEAIWNSSGHFRPCIEVEFKANNNQTMRVVVHVSQSVGRGKRRTWLRILSVACIGTYQAAAGTYALGALPCHRGRLDVNHADKKNVMRWAAVGVAHALIVPGVTQVLHTYPRESKCFIAPQRVVDAWYLQIRAIPLSQRTNTRAAPRPRTTHAAAATQTEDLQENICVS